MAPRKKNQPTQEQTTTEQAAQEQADAEEDQTAQGQPIQEQGRIQEGEHEQGPERDEFASLPNPCVYCGPSVRGVARQYTTYQGGIPGPLKEFIKEHPAARGLIVSTEKFAGVRKRLETHGTAEAIIYKKVKDEL